MMNNCTPPKSIQIYYIHCVKHLWHESFEDKKLRLEISKIESQSHLQRIYQERNHHVLCTWQGNLRVSFKHQRFYVRKKRWQIIYLYTLHTNIHNCRLTYEWYIFKLSKMCCLSYIWGTCVHPRNINRRHRRISWAIYINYIGLYYLVSKAQLGIVTLYCRPTV